MSARKKLKLNGYYKIWLVIQMTKRKSLLSGVTRICVQASSLPIFSFTFCQPVFIACKKQVNNLPKSAPIWNHFFPFKHIFRQTLQCSSFISLFLCGSAVATTCVYGFPTNSIINYLTYKSFLLEIALSSHRYKDVYRAFNK